MRAGEMRKTTGDLLWGTAISIVGTCGAAYMLPAALHDKLFKAPSGGAYEPSSGDRALFVLGLCVFVIWDIYYGIKWIRWFKGAPPYHK
jgi:hypothetical protein